jgi:hypothetical protein
MLLAQVLYAMLFSSTNFVPSGEAVIRGKLIELTVQLVRSTSCLATLLFVGDETAQYAVLNVNLLVDYYVGIVSTPGELHTGIWQHGHFERVAVDDVFESHITLNHGALSINAVDRP